MVEIAVTLSVIGIIAGIVVPRVNPLLDAAATRAAASELLASLAAARHSALAESRVVAVRLDGAAGSFTVFAGSDTILVRPVRAEHGVEFESTRDSIAYGASGRGYGAANTTVILRRGAVAETVVVSRLGRARWR
ncbi:MAG: GspH/FimT family pseudopilin [Gemmatimonadota bacterium]|nr:GspH/FimT family pseudopilin [Gemmatimonadota bacterium]